MIHVFHRLRYWSCFRNPGTEDDSRGPTNPNSMFCKRQKANNGDVGSVGEELPLPARARCEVLVTGLCCGVSGSL